MNERIRQLARQAGLRFTQLMSNPMVPVVDGKETDLEKFAELIVAECLAVCAVNTDDEPLYYKRGVIFAMNRCQQNIKRHFGVEE